MRQYNAVVDAFLRGIERARNPVQLASVASVFVSRIDTAVDRELENIGTPDALALRRPGCHRKRSFDLSPLSGDLSIHRGSPAFAPGASARSASCGGARARKIRLIRISCTRRRTRRIRNHQRGAACDISCASGPRPDPRRYGIRGLDRGRIDPQGYSQHQRGLRRTIGQAFASIVDLRMTQVGRWGFG